MSGAHLIEMWEHVSGKAPPALIASVIDPGESLLWVARIRSSANFAPFVAFGVFCLGFGALFGPTLSWGETLQDYCGSDALRSCSKLYYLRWPVVIIMGTCAISMFWEAYKSKAKPWAFTYAITEKRAIVLDERSPKRFRAVSLSSYEPRIGAMGAVWFGPTRAKQPTFARLDPWVANRAVHWANVGRLSHEETRDKASPTDPSSARHG